MTKRFYLVRHGETVKKIGDPSLSEKGLAQAKSTGYYFKNLSIQKIITSPALRSKQTAQVIANALKLEFAIKPLLKERVNWGDDPNQKFENFLVMWKKASIERDWIPQIGDSSRKAGERLSSFISSQDDEFVHTILVTHGGIITDFLCNIFDEDKLNIKFPNFANLKDSSILECSITIIDFDPKTYKYTLIELVSTKHLDKI